MSRANPRRGIARRLLQLLLQPPTHVLRLGRRIERLGLRFLELPLELSDAVVLRDFRRVFRRFLADFLGVVVELFRLFSVMPSISSVLSL